MNFTLITGASEGIGAAMARKCAEENYNLILVARSEEKLLELAHELIQAHRIRVECIALDLLSPDAPKRLWERCQQEEWPVRILINNAGQGLWGAFYELSCQAQLDVIRLNEQVMVELCHLFIPSLRHVPFAHILNIGSTASFQPVPYFSVYAASKAFVLSFSRSLRLELKPLGIQVSCLCPGPTNSQFFTRSGFTEKNKSTQFLMKPETVAEAAIRGLIANQSVIIPGFSNKIGTFVSKHLPVSWTSRFVKPYFKP
ncbi:MAG: SDR family oxidoreductase [Cyclobacteriaceae bacterium]